MAGGSTLQSQHGDTVSKDVIPGQYIVVFKDQADGLISEQAAQMAEQRTHLILNEHKIPADSMLFQYKYALKGFSAKLNPNQVDKLKTDPRVKRVSEARIFHLGIAGSRDYKSSNHSTFPTTTVQSIQTTPWGVSRVGGPLDGTGKKAWIIDSGIDLDHPDLNIDTNNSASFIANETADDNVGHGTYVAGILAAKDNSQDIVGVAAGATVISVKVCDDTGCPEPALLNGIDYVGNQANANDIVNISIWNTAGIDPDFDEAVTTAANNGARLVLIAGNASDNANNYSPGRVNHVNIWTVSAYDDNDAFATSFSNYGNPPIEYAGPGEDVPSLRLGGGWGMGFSDSQEDQGTEDGTSYAAPHLAGQLLMLDDEPVIDGHVSNDPDNNADPIASVQLHEPTIYGNTVSGQAHLDWSPVNHADSYAIYKNDSKYPSSGFSKVTETTSTEYDGVYTHEEHAGDDGWVSHTMKYRVVALSNGGYKESWVSNTVSFTYWDLPILPGGF